MESWLWTQKQDIGPSPRFGSSMVYDSSLKRIILFGGGLDWNIAKNDTWEWKDNTWTQIADSGPSPRVHYAMEYDSSRNKVVLFGGRNTLEASATKFGDTWELEGSEWTQIADTGPSGRFAHKITYDTYKKKIILFGGFSGSLYGDTWELDGSEWTQIADSGPMPRYYHAMTYDPSNHVVVVFGGFNTDRLGDTWVMSNNNVWKKMQDIGPDPRYSLNMVYADTRTVLFGGMASTLDGTTWDWDGSAWTQRQNMGPSSRSGYSMAYDSERKRVVLFGGVGSSGYLGDTWELKILTIPE